MCRYVWVQRLLISIRSHNDFSVEHAEPLQFLLYATNTFSAY